MRFVSSPPPHTRAPGWMPPPPAVESPPAEAVVPYDMAATFDITGEPGNVIQDVINVGSDGTFVAVAIGYGFKEERERPMPVELAAGHERDLVSLPQIQLGSLPVIALVDGFRLNPSYEDWIYQDSSSSLPDGGSLPSDKFFEHVLQRIRTPADFSFLLSFVDGGSGREFQDQPEHSLASLGSSNGERPFRALPHPCSFAPRSTLRLQVTERTPGVKGRLFVVLYGYRVIGLASCGEAMARVADAGMPLDMARGGPQFIPFDHVATVELTGRRGNYLEAEIPVSADIAFVATHVGYGLSAESNDVEFEAADVDEWLNGADKGDLAALPLQAFPRRALVEGIRIRPGWLRVALQDSGDLANAVSRGVLDRVFETLNQPKDVSFLYRFSDGGTARDMQNERLYNVAGLGSADGDRPFKKFARPMVFLPRSTIRVEVEEHFGRGKLYFVFQGYKSLGRAMGRR